MTIEKFLSFWSQHNTAIIEGLVALVIFLSLVLAYRSFFAKKSKSEMGEAGQGLDAAQLEKTLQKILENQSQAAAQKPSRPAVTEDLEMDMDLDALEKNSLSSTAEAPVQVAGESAAEVAQLRMSLGESHKKIETLQAQLQEALQAATDAANMNAPAADAGSGMSAAEKESFAGKIRDLEARLAEYEIISEDIADLSRYREENDQLRKELEALKAGGGAAAVAPPVAEVATESEPTPEEPPAVVEAAAPVEEPAPMVETPAADVSAGGADLIDDELMKEFAAAVEGQKNLSKVAEKAGDGSEAAKKSGDETDQLMSEFENFVAKKS
ncbi:MAG: hypothetical protein KUL82_08320 [Bdellovibrio sp.]|nr:hypothetical protein [Bdellovibrio sp.]